MLCYRADITAGNRSCKHSRRILRSLQISRRTFKQGQQRLPGSFIAAGPARHQLHRHSLHRYSVVGADTRCRMVGRTFFSRYAERFTAKKLYELFACVLRFAVTVQRHIHTCKLCIAAGKTLQRMQAAYVCSQLRKRSQRLQSHTAAHMQHNLSCRYHALRQLLCYRTN